MVQMFLGYSGIAVRCQPSHGYRGGKNTEILQEARHQRFRRPTQSTKNVSLSLFLFESLVQPFLFLDKVNPGCPLTWSTLLCVTQIYPVIVICFSTSSYWCSDVVATLKITLIV